MQQATYVCECGRGPFKSQAGLQIHRGHIHNDLLHQGRRSVRAQQVFIAAYGDGPWLCVACHGMIIVIGKSSDMGNVHHKDGNITNDAPDNLELMHARCHQQHHKLGRAHTPEHNAKVGRKGRKFTPEWRAKLSARGRERRQCPHCDYVNSPQYVGRHLKEGKCFAS